MGNIAILGYGVVGSGVAEVLEKNRAGIARKAGKELAVRYILDRRDLSDTPYGPIQAKNFEEILRDPQVEVVVEAMGGLNPAYDWVKRSLEAGKSVVTSNKELVAAKGAELLATAAAKHVNFLFEASVGGGIPIIHPLHQCLGANEIHEVAGILNGTTNYILTRMIKDGMGFDEALAGAQRLGYAEADPTADVEGIDACRKVCILASLVFGSHVYPDRVQPQGITKITAEDVQYAESHGCSIKLIGRAKKVEDGRIAMAVSPALLAKGSQLAGIDDVFNGILVRGDATGDVVFYGRGAGKLPTASAVIADIISAVQADDTIGTLQWVDSDGQNVTDFGDQVGGFYIRAVGGSDIRTLVEGAFGPDIRWLQRAGQPQDEGAFVAENLTEKAARQGAEQLAAAGVEVLSLLPVLDY